MHGEKSSPSPQEALPDPGENVILFCETFRCLGFYGRDHKWHHAYTGEDVPGVRAWIEPNEPNLGWHVVSTARACPPGYLAIRDHEPRLAEGADALGPGASEALSDSTREEKARLFRRSLTRSSDEWFPARLFHS